MNARQRKKAVTARSPRLLEPARLPDHTRGGSLRVGGRVLGSVVAAHVQGATAQRLVVQGARSVAAQERCLRGVQAHPSGATGSVEASFTDSAAPDRGIA